MKNKIRFPDFLGIGAARTGSTWLYHNLIIQSGIWLPPNKELHYFDRNIKYPSPSFLHDSSFWKRLIGREAHNRQFRQIMARKLVKNIVRINYPNFKWSFKYYTGNISDHWYSSLFTTDINKIVGEITPAYQILDEDDVRKIHELMPNTKIIFIVRNPIDRTWSQLRQSN